MTHEVEGKVKPKKAPWRKNEYCMGDGEMANLVGDKIEWEKFLEEYKDNRDKIIGRVRVEMVHMLDDAVGVIKDCMRSGTKDDGIRLKAAIWVLESEGIVKTEKFEFINYDGNFADKEKLLDELRQELLRGQNGINEPIAIEAIVVGAEEEKI